MNSVLDNIDFISRSPGGVALLRKLVLELAVRGKLVSQDPKDEPASVLFERIQRDKIRLVKEGKIKTGKEIPEIVEKEKPFKLPSSWVWVRLGELIDQINGRAFKPTDWQTTGLPIVRIQNLNNPKATYNFCNKEAIEEKYLIKKDDILISWSGTPGTSFGAFLWRGEEAALNQHINRVILFGAELYQKDYLVLMVNSQLDILISKARGAVGLRHVTMGQLNNLYVPLPPLAEQSRIVARVQELMAVLDRLEKQTNKTEEERQYTLIATTLAVSQATTHKEISSSWLRLTSDFDSLVDRVEDVKIIKAMVLELALRGKLVPQDPKDEPASVLMKRIQQEKTRLVKEGKIKTGKELTEIRDDEKTYELPNGWEWARLGEYCDVRDGTHDTPKYTVAGYPLVTSKNIYQGKLDLTDVKYVSKEDYLLISERSEVDEGDILFAMIGSIGNPTVVSTPIKFAIKNVALFKRYASSLPNLLYLHLFLTASTNTMKERSSGGVQNFVSLTFLREYLFPIPPLSEQSRIVARVQEIMAVLDRLEEKLAARDKAAILASETIVKMNQI
jgi:type I restriction enzyme S subunit